MRKRVLPPEDTPSANLSAAAAVGCSTPPSTPRNTVTATGAAIRPTIGGSGNTAKCAVRIWSASAAVKNSHPNVQVPAIAAMPIGKKTIENVLQMLQVLKMSTWMDVERKGIQSYQSDIYARFLCFGNGALTALYDHSDGFWRRQLVLTTKDRPANREDDPFLVEALSAELEGILLWCLDGLQRLLRNSYKFTVSPKAAANLETIKRSSNNVLDFLDSEGYFRYKVDFSISSRDLYEIYKLWCEDNACHPVSAARLSSEVSQNAVRLDLEPTNNIYLPGGRRVRGFMGIEALVHPAA